MLILNNLISPTSLKRIPYARFKTSSIEIFLALQHYQYTNSSELKNKR